jgi:uncharacterized membrane protein
MAVAMMSWMLAIPLLGVTTGLRSMTPMAVLCWYAHLGYIPVDGSWAAWTGRLSTAAIFTVLALGELVADKLPRTPDRTSPGPLLARLALGGLAGSIAATAMDGPGLEGALLAVVGAALGAFGGITVRRGLAESIGCADWKVAVGEDSVAILGAWFAMHVVAS